ncbi:hypothetical protein EXIGLDRAFT_757071 [Exidia glandulosa HHB12029]|uniref:SAP domain-containing protein n=1 Tax=Exidia glandulosa HHB12029 TaxID=1314781 RepID=A0A166NL94_EXIGL|nr:hypothetical protein EXIGLDRAFT_757071 [Exidia glandulosa HHB12029]
MLDLAKLKRTELQKLSKDEGLKANLKTEALVEALEAHYRANPSRKPSAQAGPSRAPSSLAMSRAPSRTESMRAPSRAESTAGRAPSRTTSQAQTGTQRKVTTSQPFRPTNSTTGASSEDAKSGATVAPAQAENSTAMTPRTLRKAKDTQLRLGVGRPKLIGGTGARATNPKPRHGCQYQRGRSEAQDSCIWYDSGEGKSQSSSRSPAVTRPPPAVSTSPTPAPARAMAGPMAMPTLPVPKQQSMANLEQRRPLWEGKLYSEPYPPPGPSALGKHARDSLGTAPNSPAVQEEQGTSTERPMRKKPRLGHGHPPVRRAAEEPQLEPRTTPGGFPLLSSTMAEFADRRAQGLSGPPPHSFRFHEYYPSIGSNDGPSPFATYQPSSGTSGSSVFEDQQQQKQQQPSTSSGFTGDERVPSINKSFGSSSASASAPKTPPRNPDNAPPPSETPLTAAYGPVIAALFRPPNPEDLPEEERSPEKKTLYGTERANDTRFGEFGWGWRY